MIIRSSVIPRLLAFLVLAAAPAAAAVIEWGGGARAILADADVSDNGILIRALAKSGASAPTVNGVTFGPLPGPDTLAGQLATPYATAALPAGGEISPAYATLVGQNERSSTAPSNTLTLTLNQLLVGHHYELQLWFHDANPSGLGSMRVKSPGSLDPWVLLDANPSSATGGRGQHALGTFTADSTTQVVQLIGNPVAALQAYQLRLISAPLARVVWDSWRETTGPSDVATEGAAFRAYAFGATAPVAPVNSVAFTRFIDQSTDTLTGFSTVGSDAFGSAALPFAGLPADYRTLLSGAASGGRAGSLTLNNLQPGQWYFVQLWANDSRASAGGRRQRVNGSLFLNANPGGPADNLAHEGGLGHWLQGRFQATAASQRLDFVSPTAVQLNALQLRAIPEPDSALMGLRARRLFSFHAFLDGVFTNSNPWVGVQARFSIGDFSRARSDLSQQAAYFASSSLAPTSSFHLWPAMDLFIRRRGFIDQLSRERFISTLRKFDYRSWSNTSNLSKLAWTMRTLGAQEFGESSFIFPDNAWRDSDPRGYAPLVARLEQEARQGTGEYASAPYGWYNVMPSLTLAQLSDDPVLRSRARIAFDAHLAQLAAHWMPGGYLATWSGRSYPLSGFPMSLGRMLWLWFGDGGRAGESQETLMSAITDYEPPLAILRAATERGSVYTARHRSDGFQTAYLYKDQFGFFSHDGWGGGDQNYPDGLRWRGMPGNYLYVTRPAVDTPSDVRASNAPGIGLAEFSTVQHLDTQLMAFDLSYKTIPVPYAIGYVPGNYTAMVNLTGNATPADGRSRIFLNYDRVMVAITADVRFTWDPTSGIYCPWPNVRTGDSEFRIAVGGVGFPKIDPTGFTSTIDHANNRFAVAIEVAHPEEFPGATAGEKLAAFRDAILASTSLTRDPATSPTTARYTTRRGDQLRVTSKSGVSSNSPRTAFINDAPVNYNDTWPMLENPWFSQPARGANATLTGGGVQTVLDLTNWTRTDTVLPVTDPLPRLSAASVLGITTTTATAVAGLPHAGATPATVTFYWGPSDAGIADPAAWPDSVPLGVRAAGPLFAGLAGLSPNVQYAGRFRAVNAAGAVWSSAVTFGTQALAPPDVPRNLRFTLSAGQVPLAWDSVPGATSYTVRRATSSGGPFSELATGLATPSFIDTTAVTGTTYFYVVSAVSAGGVSGDSGQLTATPAALPATPTGLVVTTAYRYAFLSWSPVPWAASYTVKRGTVSTGPFTVIATGLTDTVFEDTTSVHGVRYHYIVSATNLVGESANSPHFSHTVNVLFWITETSGSWSTVPWFPPARGQPVSATTTIIDFDNQSAPIASTHDRGAFTLNQLRFRGDDVTLTGDALSFAGTTPRVTVAASSASTVANALTLAAATTFDIAGSLTVQAPVAGSGNLIKTGAGTLTLAQTNTHTGNLTLGGGRLVLPSVQPGLRALTFGATNAATAGGTLELGHDASATSLLVQSTGPTNRLVIAPGRTFTLAGPHTQGGLFNGVASAHLAVSGGGAFNFNQPAGDFIVRRSSRLDLSASGPVSIIASRFVLGDMDNNPISSVPSTLILPGSADLTVRADRFALSSLSANASGIRGESTSLLATGGPGRFTVRNTAGTGPALFEVDNNTGVSITSTSFLVDLRGKDSDLWFSEFHLGCRSHTNAAGSSGSFYFDTGTLRVDGITRFAVTGAGKSQNIAVVQIDGGQLFFTGGITMASTISGENAQADLNIAGGTILSGPISITTANPGYTLGTLNITGGSLTLTGPISRGPITGIASGGYNSDGSARLILDGGLLDLGGHPIGSADFPLHTVSIISGTLKNVAAINGTAGFSKISDGLLVLDGLNTWTGNTTISTDTLQLLGTLDSPGTFTLGSEATLTGSGTLRAPAVLAGIIQPGGPAGPILRLERTVRLEPTALLTTRVNRADPAATPAALAGPTMLTYGGTLRVLHEGAPLVAGDRFVLFSATAYSGNFATVELPVLAPDLAWDTRALRSDGSILVRTAADLAASLGQTTKYWDRSATTGLQGGTGTWDVGTTANWNTAPDGSAPLDRFWPADTVHFQTGVINTITLAGPAAVSALSQSVNGTATTLTGGRLLLDGPVALSNGAPTGNQPLVLDTVASLNGLATTVHAQQPITLARGLAGTGDLTKTGASTLTLGAESPWAGALLLGGGTTRLLGATPNLTRISFGPTVGAAPGSTLELGQNLSFAGSAFRLQSIGVNVLTIPVGLTLTLTGETVLGLNTATVTGVTGSTALATTGGGELLVQTAGKNFSVAGSRSGHPAEVTLSGLGRAVIDAGTTGNLHVGVYNSNTNDSLTLPPDATLTGANFYVGDANLGGTQALRLGAGSNLINVNNLYVGQRPGSNNRSDASVTFGSTTGSLRLRATDGSSRSNLFINDNISGTGRLLTNTVDVSGHSADLLLNQLVIGRRNATSSPTQLTNDTFRWDRGTLDVASQVILSQAPANAGTGKIYSSAMMVGSVASTPVDTALFTGGFIIAQNRSTPAGSIAQGTLTFGGGTITSGPIILGDLVGTAASRQSNATLNLTGGTLTLNGAIASGTTGGAGTKTATLTLDGGALDLGGNVIGGTGPAALTTLNFLSGTLANVASINANAGLAKTGPGTLTLAGVNTFTGPISVSTGTFVLAPGATATTSISVASVATLTPAGAITGNLTLPLGATWRVRLDSATAYDQLVLAGPSATVTLGGTLDLVAASDLPAGTRFRILRNSGNAAAPVVGTFAGRAHRTPFTASGRTWYLDYTAGSGGDVDLILASTLELWRQTHLGTLFPTGSAADTADPDGDGVSNLLEYALGTTPTSGASVSAPTPRVSGLRLQVSFLRARSDVTYFVEASSALSSGSWTVIATNPGVIGQSVTVNDTVDLPTANPPRRFLRIRVTVP